MSLHSDPKIREYRDIDVKPMLSFPMFAPAQSVLTRLEEDRRLVECVIGNLYSQIFFGAVTLPYLVW